MQDFTGFEQKRSAAARGKATLPLQSAETAGAGI